MKVIVKSFRLQVYILALRLRYSQSSTTSTDDSTVYRNTSHMIPFVDPPRGSDSAKVMIGFGYSVALHGVAAGPA